MGFLVFIGLLLVTLPLLALFTIVICTLALFTAAPLLIQICLFCLLAGVYMLYVSAARGIWREFTNSAAQW